MHKQYIKAVAKAKDLVRDKAQFDADGEELRNKAVEHSRQEHSSELTLHIS
jgi:hypothetical protein